MSHSAESASELAKNRDLFRFPQLSEADFWEEPVSFSMRLKRLVACVNAGDVVAVERALHGYPGPGLEPLGEDDAGRHPLPEEVLPLLASFHTYTPHTVRFEMESLTCEHLLWHPLMTAIRTDRPDIANLLLQAGALAGFGGKDYDHPLTFAVSRGNVPMVDLLLAQGAPATSPDCKYQPLIIAVEKKQVAIARRLLAALPPGEALPYGRSKGRSIGPLRAAIESGANELLEPLLERASRNDLTDALGAALNPYREDAVALCSRLLSLGADPKEAIQDGGNALHTLFDRIWFRESDDGVLDESGPTRPFASVREDTLTLVELLLAARVPLETRNDFGLTPLLSVAAHLPFPEVLHRLISAGADKDVKKEPTPDWAGPHYTEIDEQSHHTAGLLGCAAFSEDAHPEMFRAVVALGFSADSLAENTGWLDCLHDSAPYVTPLLAADWSPQQWDRIFAASPATVSENAEYILLNPSLPDCLRSALLATRA